MKGHRIMLQLCQPREIKPNGEIVWWDKKEVPEKYEALYSYCKQDVEVERALCKRLLKLSKAEQKLWELDYYINRRGVYVDLPAAKTAIEIVEQEKDRLNLEMAKVTNNAVSMCTAVGQISDWLKLKGVDVPSLAKADVVDLLSLPTLPPDCRKALLLRQEAAKTSTAKLQAMIKGASANGRMRGLFQYHGASTGRWAGRRVQLQNLPRPKLKQDKIDEAFQIMGYGQPAYLTTDKISKFIGPPMQVMSDCIRGFLRAKPGHDFIAADFSAIEARVIAWLAGEEKILEAFREGGKIYELTASDIYRCKASDITKEDARRLVGKVAVLALGFGGGVGAMQTMCRAYDLTLEPTFDSLWARATEEHRDKTRFLWNLNGEKSEISKKEFFASDLIKQYWREANPNIVRYWNELEFAAVKAVEKDGEKFTIKGSTYVKNGSFLWCKLPSGRVICYPYPKIEMKSAFKDSPAKPTLTYMSVDSYTKKWERQSSYGGLLAENITQAVARDLLSSSLFRLNEQGYKTVMHIHDEVVTEVPKGFGTVEEMTDIMSEIPTWAQGLPVQAEGWRGERFRK